MGPCGKAWHELVIVRATEVELHFGNMLVERGTDSTIFLITL